ncbi:tetratricopeptide repeat protein [Flavobacterium sp. SM15]|uniref:tetratricopeptide repeat-containing sensor histidine kinase n=1 Tax=Flavobacterium sp. SM15 TaxID=2908005 RepID=UPI001EDB73CA|nr:tetratricopeptide repeat protein [Flavobacterium sp. SM15]MCG2611801.1 tetratricopeptide repeat protein [Flavobacterium sp. SM15]
MIRSPFLVLMFSFVLFSSCRDNVELPKSSNKQIQAYNYLQEAGKYLKEEKFDSAFLFYNKSLRIYVKEKDTAYIYYCLYQKAVVQQTYGDYNGSEETLAELLKYKLKKYDGLIYNQLGIISKEQKNYDDAEKYYSLSLKTVKSKVDSISPLNNIAAIYTENGESARSIAILEPILKSRILDVDSLQDKKARVLDNLGFSYFKQNRNQEALDYMGKSLAIRTNKDLSYGAIESYLHLAEFYQNQSLQKSNQYALKAYQNATIHKSIDERLEALSFLMTNNIKSGKNLYSSQFLSLNDSITKVRNNAKNQFAKIKYDSQIEKEENQKLKLERADNLLKLEKTKTQRLLLIIGFGLLVILIFWVVRFFKKKNRKEKQKAVHDTEARISKQLHDELANDVFQAMSFARTQDLEIPQRKETFLNALDNIYSRTRDISRENSEVITGDHFETNLKQMIVGFESEDVKIIIKDNHNIKWDKVQSENKVVVYRVLQELMVNMKKHSQASFVVVGFEDIGNAIQIKYSDNGIGMSEKLNLKNGLINAENRILSIKGTITFETDSNNGFRLSFSIPK